MTDDIKIYHVETQKDYNDLMIKLENEGYTWFSGKNPTDLNTWVGEETVIYLDYCGKHTMSYGLMSTLIEYNPNANIIKHKAKGVEQMEKVVVPQFVADWYEKHEKGRSIYGIIGLLNDLSKCDDEKMFMWKMNCEGRNSHKLSNAQEVIAKMHLYGYEIEVEKKYYWRKKKEYLCVFEEQGELYLNVNKETGKLSLESKTEIGIIQTSLTETEVRRMVSKEDFIKLEKVEIPE